MALEITGAIIWDIVNASFLKANSCYRCNKNNVNLSFDTTLMTSIYFLSSLLIVDGR
jgi:hypothetical protein